MVRIEREFDEDIDELVDVVTEALAERRPRLAARLVQLLPDNVEVDDPTVLERARRAAAMLVYQARDVELFNALDEAWIELRRRRMRRMMARQRHTGTGEQVTIPRVGRRPRKR
jgi:hypothetical protein